MRGKILEGQNFGKLLLTKHMVRNIFISIREAGEVLHT